MMGFYKERDIHSKSSVFIYTFGVRDPSKGTPEHKGRIHAGSGE